MPYIRLTKEEKSRIFKEVAKRRLEKDPDYYKKLGHLGGIVSSKGGFASDKVGHDGMTGRERARVVGARGGRLSRRGPANKK